MPSSPTLKDVHVDKILTNVSIQWRNPAYLAEKVFPVLLVEKESDKYFVYGKDSFRVEKALRADGAPAVEVDWGVSTDTYSTNEYAYSKLVTDRMRANADNPLNMDVDTTEFLTEKLAVFQENEAASIAFSTVAIPNNVTLSAGDQWSAFDTSDPFDDIETGKESIRSKAGREPNLIICGSEVFAKLKHHPDLLERVKYTAKGILTEDILASLFGVESFLVGRAMKDTAVEGQTPSLGYIWGKDLLIAYVAPRPGLKTLTLGLTLRVRGYRKTKRFRLDLRGGDLIEVSDNYCIKIVASDCGYLIKSAVA